MLYHITYIDRYTRQTEVGRVSIDSSVKGIRQPAHKNRQRAIQAAYWKYSRSHRSSISAVMVSR